MGTAVAEKPDTLRALPGDDVRQILWRFADRYDLQMLVQSARAVARGPVARLVAAGARNSHEWTAGKVRLLEAFDESGITAVFMDPRRAATSPVRRTWRWRWWPSNWRGWMPAPPRAAWPDAWRWRPFTSAARPNSATHYMSRALRRSPARTASPGAARSR